VRERLLSPVELTQACLERIAQLNSRLNAFITVTPEQALAAARRAEADIASGRWRGPLHGIPIAVKDNIDTAGVRTTAGSAVFADRVPAEDAEVVSRLKAAGAILLGKLNMHEFGVGATSAVSHFGPVRNPWDLERVAGGSSGGSAAAVSACLCFGALGTDTGGSIRIPAACCGVVGLKPSLGVVSTHGTVPMSSTFDCIGPLARTVADTVLLFRAMTSHPVARSVHPDALPATSSLRVGSLSARAALCDRPFDLDVQSAFDTALDVIRPLVRDLHPAEFPVPEVGGVIDAELFSFHAPLLETMAEAYDPRTRAVILAGRELTDQELARQRLELLRCRALIHGAFEDVDLLVVPTLPEPAMAIGDAIEPFAQAACTFAFSVAGVPALTVPCGFSRTGLPIGLTIAGPWLAEPRVFALAQAFERATGWHQRWPAVALR
jgi:aspartyl-tRNA(Asn)/glutamyl-tRNA(Gln) amidotransferase subunit A